jgi:hypothetical protein
VGELPRGAVSLPDIPLHLSQRQALELIEQERRVCLACGRRWGKSTVIVTLAVDYALAGRSVGVFAPTYRFLRPLIDGVALAPPICPASRSTAVWARSASTMARSTSVRSTSPAAQRAEGGIGGAR